MSIDAATQPKFQLGFATLAAQLDGAAGHPLEDEQHDPAAGETLQRTSTGLLVWRVLDNWTGFTDGFRTWVNSPFGLQDRLNSERLPWERGR
jgi:hypothetical protein